jgi:hypothetical protein
LGDFIVALPESAGQPQIMVMVDCFSKMAHFIALPETATAKDSEQALLKEVWRVYRLPESIFSGAGTK